MQNLNIELLSIGGQHNIDKTTISYALSFSASFFKEAVFDNLPFPKELT